MSRTRHTSTRALLFLSVFLAAGCLTPNRLANRLTTAPNQQSGYPAARMAAAWSKSLASHDPFNYRTITVGHPPAELALAELPPGKYDVDFSSKYETGSDGQKFLNFHFHYKNAGNVQPVKKERGTIVLLHGYMLSREIMYPWAFALARVGFRVLAVDLRGHGKSTGQTISFGKIESADLIHLLDHLQENSTVPPSIGVMGISMGATLALNWAARDPRVHTVVAIAAYNQPEKAFLRFAHVMRIPASDQVTTEALQIAARRLDLAWNEWSGENALRAVRVPVLLIGGEQDRIVPRTELEYLHQLAPPGSRLIIVPEATHDSIGLSLSELGPALLAWFLQHPASRVVPANSGNPAHEAAPGACDRGLNPGGDGR